MPLTFCINLIDVPSVTLDFPPMLGGDLQPREFGGILHSPVINDQIE